jgi:hypothetical protein
MTHYINLDGVNTPVRVTRVGENGFDWVTPDGSQAGAICTLPLYNEAGEIVQPDAAPSADSIERGIKLMVKTLAQTDVISSDDALDVKELFDRWDVGLSVIAGAYYRHYDGLYRVVQAHTTQADWEPGVVPSLWTRVNKSGEIPDWSPGSWAKDTQVRHNGKIWLSMVDNNVWEPGAEGIYDNIWKAVVA